jgi:membrane-bound metal-dependent hydrolase YbcI (DUF457 family)
VVFWFAGLAFVLVWAVFKDPAIDYRLVVAGALLPDVVDGLGFGGARYLHTLVASVALLVVVMLATRGRRGRRRRLLAVPIGTFCHLLLDGMWARTATFWWPFFGWRFPSGPLPSWSRPVWLVVVEEVVGLGALAWCWRRFEFGSSGARRAAFLRTGRLGREFRSV